MKTSNPISRITITAGLIMLAILLTWYIVKPKAQPEATQSSPAVQSQATTYNTTAGPGVASGTDTIRMIFNKQSAIQILWALQNQYPTPQNSPNLTVANFTGTANVFNYLETMLVKKWPDIAPKKAPEPTSVKK